MKFIRRSPMLLRNLAFMLLLLLLASALYQLAARYPLHADITQSRLNSLSAASVNALKMLHGEVRITVYATEQDAKLGDLRRLVREFVAIYQRYKPDIALTFVDPQQQPDAARAAGIVSNGEMMVEYGGRTVRLTSLNEQTLSSALLGLAHAKSELLMYLDGHGGRKLDGKANFDLGDFGNKLKQNGYRIAALNLALAPEVPINTSVLVLTQPQTQLLPGEVKKILRYIDNGGNLLWLIDAEPMRGLDELAEKLGVLLTPGIIIDPAAADMNVPANWAISADYPLHAVTANFNLLSVFPEARALGREEHSLWQRQTLVEAAPLGWVSRKPFNSSAKLHLDKNQDVPGPFDLAIALQRNVNNKEQRIVVVGGASFLANTYSGNAGNIDLGINMINWLSEEDALITVQPRANKDGSVVFSSRALTYISIVLVIALPSLLLLGGVIQWWRRRH